MPELVKFMNLSNVSVFCFAASYIVALGCEVTRLFFRAPIRVAVMVGFAVAGLLAQTIYLWLRVKNSVDSAPLSSWFDWLLLVAWGLAAAYLATVVRRPQAAIGIFLLPLVLLFIGVASLFRDEAPFPRVQAQQAWGIIHGISLLLGTVVVMLGFVR